MGKIKAVLFDGSGVLIHLLEDDTNKEVSRLFNVNVEQARQSVIDSMDGILRGKDTEIELTKKIAKYLNKDVTSDIIGFWAKFARNHARLNKQVVDLAERLRLSGYETGIVSNIFSVTTDYIKEANLC